MYTVASCFLTGEDIFSFPVFTDAFCSRLLEELDAYEKCPVQKSRPNTMNRYGVSTYVHIHPYVCEQIVRILNPVA